MVRVKEERRRGGEEEERRRRDERRCGGVRAERESEKRGERK